MAHQYVAPAFEVEAFNCPHCGAYAEQVWNDVGLRVAGAGGFRMQGNHIDVSECRHCGEHAIWIESKLVYPLESPAPLAHPEMPAEVAEDFNEARQIVTVSPRGACALLRLALQKLCVALGESGQHIDDDIASLVDRGLLPQVQQSLDALRVIGHHAVHPGELDLKDDMETALALFVTINVIVEQLIAVPKQVATLYASLPQGAVDAVQERESGS